MSSDYPNYGAVLAKNVKLDRSGLVFVDSTDDSKTVTLKLKSGALSAGNVDVTLPLSAQELGGGSVPDGDTAGDALVWSGSAWVQKTISGNASLSAEGALTVANNSIENAMLQDNSVNSAKIEANAVTTAKIDNNAVVTGKIQDGAVQQAKIANGAVGETQLASNACTADKIANDAVTSAKIANDAVGASELGVTAGSASASKALVVDASSDVAGVNELGLTTLAFGNNWRVQISGGNMVFQYSADGGSTWQTKQTFNSA
jgi:hypothetical protein